MSSVNHALPVPVTSPVCCTRTRLHPLALAICASLVAPVLAQAAEPAPVGPGDATSGGPGETLPVPLLLPSDPLGVQAGMQRLAHALVADGLRHELRDRLGETRQDRRAGDAEAMGVPGAVWARASQQQVRDGRLGDGEELQGAARALWVGTHLYAYQGGGYLLGGVMAQVQDTQVQVRAPAQDDSPRVRSRSSGVGAYASWFADPDMQQGLHVDAWAMTGKVTRQQSHATPTPPRTAPRTRSTVHAVSVEVGHAVIVRDSGDSALFLEPQLQLSYVDQRVPLLTHGAPGATGVSTVQTGGLQVRSGIRVYGRASDGLQNRVQPYAAVNHYRSKGGTGVGERRVLAGLPANVLEAKAGVELQLSPALTAWGSVAMQRGGSYRSREATAGLKLTW